MILDTTFLIDFFRGDTQAIKKLEALESDGMPVFTTSICVFEVMQGIRGEKEDKKAQDFFASIQVFPLKKETAIIAGRMSKKLMEGGITINTPDCMIAGIAISHGETLLTRNVKHFSEIEGLKTETY